MAAVGLMVDPPRQAGFVAGFSFDTGRALMHRGLVGFIDRLI
jgi:hypothetical protein